MVSFLKHIVCWGNFWPKVMVFDQIEDNVNWPPRSNNCFCIWKNLLNDLCVTDALNRPQKHPKIVLYGMFSEPYSQYPVQARAYMRSGLSLVFSFHYRKIIQKQNKKYKYVPHCQSGFISTCDNDNVIMYLFN